ncbi:sugar phosphate isomerase/epimerase [Roseibium sp. RKSG952]|uniref:sugar phosphate isomerase/epimerase family protein n=1 Tax=Roseibium sp. RKSG952 TaxID=2529384 RepID=UPI0012BBA03A|nr:sugar phosphate isomerase/epimerase [Roseibium sp. RKSG952]MTI00374.1 sugar phosphate isomerase/epimerase [Roseibium sp. RKSG952]
MRDVSFQLYSARHVVPLAPFLTVLAGLGYTQVEGYSGLFAEPHTLKRQLDDAGLSMPSGHLPLDMLENNLSEVIAVAQVLGMKAVYCPYLDESERPGDAAGWQALGERLNQLVKPLRDAGLSFGWHNHDFEFQPLSDGSLPMDCLMGAGEDLNWEADIAWIVRGGQDPLPWIERYGGRIRAVHVKDIARGGEGGEEDGWSDIGDGMLDWPGLFRALKACPVDIFVLEHDNPSDAARFAARSIASVKSM